MKKSLALLVVIAMLVSLAACGKSTQTDNSSGSKTSNKSEDNKSDSGKSDSEDKSDNGAIDTSEHVVITYMTTGDKPTNGATEEVIAELNKILKEKVNAEIEIYYIGWTDYLSNYNLTLAQMDGTVDLVGTASDWLDAWPNAKNGAFLELSEEMLKTYAPKTWEQVSPENWEMSKYNGEIYLIPEDNFVQWTNHGFIYRLDWAKEAGLTNGAHTWDDMTTFFKYVKENKKDVLPWDSDGSHNLQMASGWMASHTDFVPIDGIAAGGLYGGSKDDLYTVWSPFYEGTELVEFAKLMKQWDEIGVWKTDVLNNTGIDNREEMYLEQTSADQHHTETWFGTVEPEMRKRHNVDTGFFYFGEESGNVVSLNITHGAMAISAASKNPERALMVYDLIRNDEECYRLFNYGIQGKQYDIDENGYKVEPEGYNSDTDAITINYWWGRNDNLELKDGKRNHEAYEELKAAYDKVKITYPYGQFIAEVSSIQAQINNINEIHNNYMKQIAYGKYNGSAEDIVAEYRAALKQAGFEDVISELQAQVDALYR